MPLRDLPVALPGSVGSNGSDLQAEDIGALEALQAVSPVVVSPKPVATGSEPQAEPPAASAFPPEPIHSLTAEAGRVLTIEAKATGEIASIQILSQSSHGHVGVNPDNSLSLVLSEDPHDTADISFRYRIVYENGGTQDVQAQVDVTAGQAPEGWGSGDFYMLETDADGRVVVEHGENHRKIHVTEGAHGLTRAGIAEAEGIAESQVTAEWLKGHPEYGATPDKALATDLGMELWYATTGREVGPNSNWLLFERGYEYEGVGRVVDRGAAGESALNPMYVGAYGEGNDPLVDSKIDVFQDPVSHVVIQGIDSTNFRALLGENLLLDDVGITRDGLVAENVRNFTLMNSDIVDVARAAPLNSGAAWDAGANKVSGVYVSNIDGALIQNNLFDRNGWAEGYDPALSASDPMPPSKFNHNLYVQSGNIDVTIRDNVLMRGSSFGAQVRPGGVLEDNTFLDNNAAVNFFGLTNHTLALNNVVTSAGHRQLAMPDGALSMGIDNYGKQDSLIGNIIAHLSDPNNPAEQAAKTIVHPALADTETYVDDTIIYNWGARGKSPYDQNLDGLSLPLLNQTTIQNFTAQLLGRERATISDLADYLRAQPDGRPEGTVDADVVNAFFREGFGLDTTLRAGAEVLRFAPDHRAEGLRWDNRLNWSTGDLPGTQNGDSVDLGGNRVLFGSETVTVDDFIFGDFGQLKATSGRLEIGGDVSTARTGNLLHVDNAGQVWVDGYGGSGLLDIVLTGGRFANTGAFAGETRISVSEDAQLLLATADARFDLAGGSSLTITGGRAKVGFDGGDGTAATLRMHDAATLSFVADATGLGKIAEFRSGAFATPDVMSGLRLDGDLSVDLSALGTKTGGAWTLIDADQMIGSFDGISIAGLGTDRDALIRYDYARDEVVLLVSEAGLGSGQIQSAPVGDADFAGHVQDAGLEALWTDLHAAMPQVTDDPI
ncbi:right-handed parallel beta-helix repeat-containing protein [Paracoccus angustae]|uniref:Right-handed parallel beta-helix repeat-containing protein n=1 Tax=Paracoccus angustae TaxID=1671480 RepID=A0ABV7U846_9RHOB